MRFHYFTSLETAFQQEVKTVLTSAVTLHEEIEAGNEEARASSIADTPRKVADALTEFAINLEHTDLPPTSSQRELLDYEKSRFDNAENEWKGLRVNFPWFIKGTRMGQTKMMRIH